MSSMFTKRAFHLASFALPLALAFSCKVESKDDYTFTDDPTESGGSSGKAGSGGRGGSAGSSTGGKGGTSGSGSGAEAGEGNNEGGAGGTSGRGGSSGSGGTDAGGESGSGNSGNGGEGGEFVFPSGGQPGEGGAGGEVPVDPRPCKPDQCVHGVCVPGEGEKFTCDCDVGYSGDLCETNTNDCDPNPCANGGVCSDEVNGFSCDCTGTGYLGATCSVGSNSCVPTSPCEHGICVPPVGGGSGFTCDCTATGYEGTYCEKDINDCAVNPCQNGGRCTDTGVNSYSCDCRGTHYEGTLCTEPLCGNGKVDPDEETDSTRDGTKEVPVDPVTCRFDFSRITQWFCTSTCGHWGDKKDGCQQEDADAFCRLKMDNPRATARSFELGPIDTDPGVCCPTVNPRNACTVLGNFGNRGVNLTVTSTDNLSSSHGRNDTIVELVCTGERIGL